MYATFKLLSRKSFNFVAPFLGVDDLLHSLFSAFFCPFVFYCFASNVSNQVLSRFCLSICNEYSSIRICALKYFQWFELGCIL